MKTITISRQYGSGGRYIAALLSEKMENYDICLNTSVLSEEECVELLMKLAE